MVVCMKTTIEITDSLLTRAKRLARREGITIRSLVEEGLRSVVENRAREGEFHLRRVGFGGRGLAAEYADGDFERLRDAAYEGRGG